MIRMVCAAAVAAASLTLAAAPALAQSPYYSATLVGKAKKSSLVTRNVVWKCADNVCTTGRSTERDGTMCELVVLRAGELSSFSAGGTAFDDETLKRCNSRAR